MQSKIHQNIITKPRAVNFSRKVKNYQYPQNTEFRRKILLLIKKNKILQN